MAVKIKSRGLLGCDTI